MNCAAAIIHRNHFFRLYQHNKSSEFKVKFRQASKPVIVAKLFLELPNLHMLIKQESPSLLRILALVTFGKLLIAFSTENTIPSLFNNPKVLSSASDKATVSTKNFSKTPNLEDSGISLPALPCRTNLKLHNISVTPMMVKKVIMNLDSSKASGDDYNVVVVLKDCDPKLSYILAELFNMCLKESCFPGCWKVSLAVPVFKNVGERSTGKNERPVSLLSVVSKVIEKLKNDDYLENVAFFLISSMVLGLFDKLQIF